MKTFINAFRFMADNPHLLLTKTGEHLELSGAALGIALLLALPIGLWLGHLHRGLFLAASVSNVGRALPSLVLIAFGLTVWWLALRVRDRDGVRAVSVAAISFASPLAGVPTEKETAASPTQPSRVAPASTLIRSPSLSR